MRAKNNLLLIAFVAIILPALSSCFSPYRGDGGNLVIRFGEGGNRAALTLTTRKAFNHTITVSGGPGETQVKKGVKLGDTVSFSVAPGEWTINVEAWLGGVLRATGDETRNIGAGRNSVDIGMTALNAGLYKKVDGMYSETGKTALAEAIPHAVSNPGTYVMLVDEEDPISSGISMTADAVTGAEDEIVLDLTLQSHDKDKPLILSGVPPMSMFTVNAHAALTLDNVSLVGLAGPYDNSAPLVAVSGGKLTMKDGAKISGNINNSSGVNGGGVSVTNNGTFDMKGGEIFGNTAGGLGGGVYVASGGSFSKTGGTIYGSNGGGTNSNNAVKGHAVYVGSDPAKYRDNTAGPLDGLDSGNMNNWNSIYRVDFITGGGSPVAPITGIESGEIIEEPAVPTKTGYERVFEGWYKDTTFVDDWDFAADTVTGNIILYAKWRAYAIGDTGPGGGIIFYRAEGGFDVPGIGTAWYLEASNSDVAQGEYWIESSGGLMDGGPPPKTDMEIGKGWSNTRLLVRSSMMGDAPAARACDGHNEGGMSDWFLPSIDELSKLYDQKERIPNLGNALYISSYGGPFPEMSARADAIDFRDGSRDTVEYTTRCRVRPVRAF